MSILTLHVTTVTVQIFINWSMHVFSSLLAYLKKLIRIFSVEKISCSNFKIMIILLMTNWLLVLSGLLSLLVLSSKNEFQDVYSDFKNSENIVKLIVSLLCLNKLSETLLWFFLKKRSTFSSYFNFNICVRLMVRNTRVLQQRNNTEVVSYSAVQSKCSWYAIYKSFHMVSYFTFCRPECTTCNDVKVECLNWLLLFLCVCRKE